MPRRLLAALLTAAALAGCGADGPQRSVPLRDGHLQLGFNEDLALVTRTADTARWQRFIDADADLHLRAGSTILRTPIHWDAIQPREGGPMDFSAWDRIVDTMERSGVKVLLVLGGPPDWARATPRRCPACPGGPPDAAHLDDWERFAAAVVQRYRSRLVGLEAWNEPNLPGFWQGPPDARAYTRLLCAAHRALKGKDVPLGGGSLATGPGFKEYLATMFAAGAGDCMEALSFHPYPHSTDLTGPSSEFRRVFTAVRALRDRHAKSLRLWPTEIGLSVGGPFDEADQARVLAEAYRQLDEMGRDDVDLVIVHTLVGQVRNPGGAGYGVVRAHPGGLVERPAYRALARRGK